jgi:glycosyltransferase involved in cell wall biosynthesis
VSDCATAVDSAAKRSTPRVSIGLPVYNGENYLRGAVDSLLGQTYEDFELIISDNASTDGTSEICQELAAKDPRIRYSRNWQNIGATQNWYRTLDLSVGEYYAGAAHDDLYHPAFLQKCVAVLEQNPFAVVCYAKTKVIDEAGQLVGDFAVSVDGSSSSPHVRLYNMIAIDHLCVPMYGLMRTSVLRKTRVYAGYVGCDRNTLAELSLLGTIREVPEYLFYHRLYPQALGAALNSGRSLQELLRLDPGTNWRARFPAAIRFSHYFTAVSRAPISRKERALAYFELVRLVASKSRNRLSHRLR